MHVGCFANPYIFPQIAMSVGPTYVGLTHMTLDQHWADQHCTLGSEYHPLSRKKVLIIQKCRLALIRVVTQLIRIPFYLECKFRT